MLDLRFSRRTALRTAGGLALASALPLRAFAAGSTEGPNVTPMSDIKGSMESWDWSLRPPSRASRRKRSSTPSTFRRLYKNLQFRSTIFGYTDLLPKLTVAWRAGNVPDIARCAIQWSPQFVGAGQCAEITEEELGIPFSQFLPGSAAERAAKRRVRGAAIRHPHATTR